MAFIQGDYVFADSRKKIVLLECRHRNSRIGQEYLATLLRPMVTKGQPAQPMPDMLQQDKGRFIGWISMAYSSAGLFSVNLKLALTGLRPSLVLLELAPVIPLVRGDHTATWMYLILVSTMYRLRLCFAVIPMWDTLISRALSLKITRNYTFRT